MTTPSLYGKGLYYPIQLVASGSKPKIVSDVELVYQSIEQIIMTDVYERPFLVKNGVPYGTRIPRALFEPADVFIDVFRYDVPRALGAWEPRIMVMSADAMQAPGDVHSIQGIVRFRFKSTGELNNYVKPYALRKE